MARRADVDAVLRLGVRYLRGVGGLAPTVVALAGVTPSSLGSRAGWDDAFARIRATHPADADGPARLTYALAPSVAAVRALDGARRVLRALPELGGKAGEGARTPFPRDVDAAAAGWRGRHPHLVTAFRHVSWVADALGLRVADVTDPGHLVRLAAAARLSASRHSRPIVPWEWRDVAAYALADPVRDAVALAHARPGAKGASAPVRVLSAFKSEVLRARRHTGVRLLHARPWHADPERAAAMFAAAGEWCLSHAAWRVEGPPDGTWRQALLHDLDPGYECHVMGPDGRVSHHVVPEGRWDRVDRASSVTAAMALPATAMPTKRSLGPWPSGSMCQWDGVDDTGKAVMDVCDELLPAVEGLPRSRRVAFAMRVADMAVRGTHAAVVTFGEGVPGPLRAVAAHVTTDGEPNRARRNAGGVRDGLLAERVTAYAMAGSHRDPAAVLAAAARVPVLAEVARFRDGWRGASEALADGSSDDEALRRYASAVAGWPANKGAARVLRCVTPDEGGRSHLDAVRIQVALSAAAPSRPPLRPEELPPLLDALMTLGTTLSPLDPFAVAAVVVAVTSAPDGHPRPVADGFRDVVWAFDQSTRRLGLSTTAAAALREEALFPRGRSAAGLARISAEWHARTARQVRERHGLLCLLVDAQRREGMDALAGTEPWDYPVPFVEPVTVGGVEVVPLRSVETFHEESAVQSNCVSGYADEARRGQMLVLSLRSAAGRSTAGYLVRQEGDGVRLDPYQHHGDQGRGGPSAPPPPGHAEVLAEVAASLARTDGIGDPGWRERMGEAVRAHLVAGAHVGEEALSPARRAELREFDLAQLRPLLGRGEAALDLAGLTAHAEGLVERRAADLARLRDAMVRAERPLAPRRATPSVTDGATDARPSGLRRRTTDDIPEGTGVGA